MQQRSTSLQAALDDERAREALFEGEPGAEVVTFLRRVGAYVQEIEDPQDPQNAYGGGGGRMKREAVPLDRLMTFDEYRHLMEMGATGRILVARHPSTPESALLALAADPDRHVASAVCARPGLAVAVMRALAVHPSPIVILQLARLPDLDDESADRVSRHPEVIHARRPRPQPAPRRKYGKGNLERALKDAAYRATMLREDSDAGEFLRGMGALGSPDRSFVFNHYKDLMTKGDYARTLVAKHPGTPEHRLIELVETGSAEVQSAVLENVERCTVAVFEAAAKSEHPAVREKAATLLDVARKTAKR